MFVCKGASFAHQRHRSERRAHARIQCAIIATCNYELKSRSGPSGSPAREKFHNFSACSIVRNNKYRRNLKNEKLERKRNLSIYNRIYTNSFFFSFFYQRISETVKSNDETPRTRSRGELTIEIVRFSRMNIHTHSCTSANDSWLSAREETSGRQRLLGLWQFETRFLAERSLTKIRCHDKLVELSRGVPCQRRRCCCRWLELVKDDRQLCRRKIRARKWNIVQPSSRPISLRDRSSSKSTFRVK